MNIQSEKELIIFCQDRLTLGNTIEELNNKLVLYDSYNLGGLGNDAYVESFVMESYYELVKERNSIPSLTQLFDQIECHNNSIFEQMALIDIMSGFDISYIESTDLDDLICEQVNSYLDMYSYNGYMYYESYVLSILDRFEVSYREDNHSQFMEDLLYSKYENIDCGISDTIDYLNNSLDKFNEELIVNDCQRILIPSLTELGIFKCGKQIYVSTDNDDEIKLIDCRLEERGLAS